ncbi:MAG: transmembrane 9 family protein [Clostridiales bacterium]|nr:transmembrane 9 family protein [Clostridiales bacterium]
MKTFEGRRFSAQEIAGVGVLLALVIVLQVVGGSISIGVVQLNFTLIPIVLGAILFGAGAGAFLGFACGVIILIQVIIGAVPFYALIWANDPIVTTLVCLTKTTVAGFVAGIIYKLIANKNGIVAMFVASALVPIINTLIFVVGCLFMFNSVHVLSGSQNVLVFILVSIVTFNFFVELGINLLVSPALAKVAKIITKKR